MKNPDSISQIELRPSIRYIPASEDPLSADVVLLEGADYLYIFDVGASPDVLAYLKSLTQAKCVILSHFHQDHMGNLEALNPDKVLVSPYTARYLPKGENFTAKVEVVEEAMQLKDGIELSVLPLTSSHAKGCLALVCDKIAFLGDGTYSGNKKGMTCYNVGLLQQEMKELQAMDVDYFALSHKKKFLQPAGVHIKILERFYDRRDKNSSYIEVKTWEEE